MTLTVFHWSALAGHLPFYGAVGILVFWTPDAEDRDLWLKGILQPAPEAVGSSA